MRIACLQFAPHVGDVVDNLSAADAVLDKLDPADLDGLDLLVLPELAFTGASPASSLTGLRTALTRLCRLQLQVAAAHCSLFRRGGLGHLVPVGAEHGPQP